MFRLASDEELTDKKLGEFLREHSLESTFRYQQLKNAYETDYPIFYQEKKPEWKPDNRIAVNFAKYIVDTMNGFFIGHPIKITADEDSIGKFVEFLDQYNDQDDNNAELSKICSIYGKGYEMYYVDDVANIGITYLTPMDAFMIYDDSVLCRPRNFVRLYLDADNVLHGSVSDESKVRYFTQKGRLVWEGEEKIHGFDGVPATEYVENEEQLGIFEPVLTMINAYNKAISEKANDVDYFADAYMKVLGAYVDDDSAKKIRDNRIVNFPQGMQDILPEVEFMSKPDGDATQEHLIDRLERLIFQISMVANISDENFGTSSGIALKYKLQAMSDLEKTKERKFTSGMNRRYKLIFSNPVSGMKKDDWVKLHYRFTPNFPANVLEETQIAQNLDGIVSQETLLSVLSVVDNAQTEIQKIEQEKEKAQETVTEDRLLERLNNGQQNVLEPTGSSTAS
ncbi:phage portal protein [Novisyntrophococcus fermenticellae]|uniref:phage portal protein n=1 Tax=Novisyntrophococcus fermenticellae TaxID=2068655 RepID=UPI001E2AC5C9|nr:phage portal protein [Novisyntrophococcus fermenticellae]